MGITVWNGTECRYGEQFIREDLKTIIPAIKCAADFLVEQVLKHGEPSDIEWCINVPDSIPNPFDDGKSVVFWIAKFPNKSGENA